jgi:hypothetical protein
MPVLVELPSEAQYVVLNLPQNGLLDSAVLPALTIGVENIPAKVNKRKWSKAQPANAIDLLSGCIVF